MNSLSWMIYLADLTGNIAGLLGLLSFLTGTGAVIATVMHLVWAGDTPNIYSYEDADRRAMKVAAHDRKAASAGKWGPRLFITCGVFALLCAVLPSKATMYAIAASETGEDVLNSETGGKAVKALNAWLDRQIAGEAQEGAQ